MFVCASMLLAVPLSAQAPQRPHIVGISHFAIYAHDYEKSRAFYGQFLGFEEPYNLKNPDGSASMTFFKINDRQTIELFPEKQAGSDRLNHISLQTDDIEDWKDQEIICYCRSGNRSGQACMILEGAGFTNLKNLSGGMNAWQDRIGS